MRTSSAFLFISVCSYCVIMLDGSMVSIPMFFYLSTGWLVADDNFDRLFIILSLVGFTLFFIPAKGNPRKRLLKYLAAFPLILSPLVHRLSSVPIALFNYARFWGPTIVFLSSYLLFLLFLALETRKAKFL